MPGCEALFQFGCVSCGVPREKLFLSAKIVQSFRKCVFLGLKIVNNYLRRFLQDSATLLINTHTKLSLSSLSPNVCNKNMEGISGLLPKGDNRFFKFFVWSKKKIETDKHRTNGKPNVNSDLAFHCGTSSVNKGI